jgi:hypothetical protein
MLASVESDTVSQAFKPLIRTVPGPNLSLTTGPGVKKVSSIDGARTRLFMPPSVFNDPHSWGLTAQLNTSVAGWHSRLGQCSGCLLFCHLQSQIGWPTRLRWSQIDVPCESARGQRLSTWLRDSSLRVSKWIMSGGIWQILGLIFRFRHEQLAPLPSWRTATPHNRR